jgi:hypothetical protein
MGTSHIRWRTTHFELFLLSNAIVSFVSSWVDIAIGVLENAVHLSGHEFAKAKLWPATCGTLMQHDPPYTCFSLPFT